MYDVLKDASMTTWSLETQDIVHISGVGRLNVPIKVGYKPTPMFCYTLVELSTIGMLGPN